MKHEKIVLFHPLIGYKDLDAMSSDELYGLWRAYYPKGSGPLGVMKQLCGAIELIAKLKGIDTSVWPEKAQSR